MKSSRIVHREAKELWRLCVTNGRLDESRVRRAVQLIVRARRPGNLAVLSRFLRLVKLDRVSHSATIQSAVAVPPDVQLQIEMSLARMYGEVLAVQHRHDPDLIGGVRITVGSDVYDGSVKGALSGLSARFADAGGRAA